MIGFCILERSEFDILCVIFCVFSCRLRVLRTQYAVDTAECSVVNVNYYNDKNTQFCVFYTW